MTEIIAGNNVEIKNELDQAIREAIDVILGEKEAYLISNKHFYFTNFLIDNREILEKESITDITKTTYKNIITALHA
ncbi:hypothetical protein [Chryseobacterium polytrichastri]|uniref:hypothetical protein n=1 Tax=Chryseobacterium polytrichastri TaxID=1302687 RepID=UPI001114B0BB|nr:hypothetical protein [Chryseobacterium polytrichastri]